MKLGFNHSWQEWIKKAESDRRVAHKIVKSEPEIACFHAQQCAEKYLKAILAKEGGQVPKIHDLLALLLRLAILYFLYRCKRYFFRWCGLKFF